MTRSAISPLFATNIFLKRGFAIYSMIMIGVPYSTGVPSWTSTRLTMPENGEGMWFIVFIASTMTKVSPSLTASPTSANF